MLMVETFYVYGWKTTFLDVKTILNRSRGFARLYFQRLILKFNKSKMAATETRKVFYFHNFGTKRGSNINKTTVLDVKRHYKSI